MALVVASDHFRESVLRPLGIDMSSMFKLGINAGFAVMFFYVISGFLISTALASKYEGRPGEFYLSRFIRIFSLYWPLLAMAFIFVSPIRDTFAAASWPDKVTNLFLLGGDWRVAFASFPEPHFGALPLWIGQAWTLGAELTFYAIAPALLRRWKLALAVFLVSAMIRAVAVVLNGGFALPWTYTFFPATIIFFLLGHFARVLAHQFVALRSAWTGTGLFLVVVSALTLGAYADWDSWRFWLATLTFAGLLPSVFLLTKDNKILNTIGDLSYPVYLLHSLVMVGLLEVVAPTAAAAWFGMSGSTLALYLTLSFLACVFVVSAVVHFLFEKPLAGAARYLVSHVGGAIGPHKLLPREIPVGRIVDH